MPGPQILLACMIFRTSQHNPEFMFFAWLRSKLREETVGTLEAIFIAPAAGAPMMSVKSVLAISEGGLQGDRYVNGTGFWKLTDSCQVTLISVRDLEIAEGRSSLEFDHGNHRRNLVISGMRTRSLEGRTFRIGDAILKYQKPRPPCGYLDKIQGQGMARALGKHSGICLEVLRSGRLAVGDKVNLINEDQVQAYK